MPTLEERFWAKGELNDKEMHEAALAVPEVVMVSSRDDAYFAMMRAVAHAQRRKLATYLIQRSEQMYGEGNMTARWLMEEFHDLEPWPDPEPTGETDG